MYILEFQLTPQVLRALAFHQLVTESRKRSLSHNQEEIATYFHKLKKEQQHKLRGRAQNSKVVEHSHKGMLYYIEQKSCWLK